MQSLLKKIVGGPNLDPAFFDLGKVIDSSRGTAIRKLLRGVTTLSSAFILSSPYASFAAPTTIEMAPLVAKATYLAPLDTNQEIGVTLCLPLSDPKGAAEFERRVSTPGDALFHRYITPQEFAARYGADA